jgi:Leucine-rich repeat (LRR) protein
MKKLTNLWLRTNQIEIIEKNSFVGLESLEILKLNGNKLKTIQTFNSLMNVIELRLSNNRITHIEENSLKELSQLEKLDLSNNQITFIHENTFENLKDLMELLIDNNQIKVLNREIFRDLIGLTSYLNLMSNKIETIESGTFRNLIGLKEISLSYNHLNKIEKHSFQNFTSLVLLDLSHNYLDQLIDVFDVNVKIEILDLSFNFIKKFENIHSFRLQNLNLNFNDNGIKILKRDFFKGNFLLELVELDLGLNELSLIDKFTFTNATKIKILFLNDNKFTMINSIGLESLKQLESIDLSDNLIEYVNENDFGNLKNLKSINLNNNLIKNFQDSSLKSLNHLDTFLIANNSLEKFDLRILNSSENFLTLDLSFNNISFESLNNLKSIQRIKLEKIGFSRNNSFETFTNELIIELDFSQNNLNNIFEKFSNLTKIEILILKKVNLQSMEQIRFQNFLKLKKLDLSFNNLTRLNYDSFKNLKVLEYLDLSFNQIDFIDGRIFGDWGDFNERALKYLNLESNRITKFEDSLVNLIKLVTFVISNNQIQDFPLFGTHLNSDYSLSMHYFYFNHNKIKSLDVFPSDIFTLIVLNFDFNEISFIKTNAFEDLTSLQNLSLSHNFLKNLTKEIFFNQLKLTSLNLSHNLIEFIELNSFQNQIELKVLDLSFNRLLSIENNIFNGLENLNDLYLLNNFTFRLFNQSFNHLINIGNIHLTRPMIQENKCLFMHSIEREVKRNVGDGKYKFFKSINLISNDFHDLTPNEYCELTFEFLQFKIHWNLKSDYENEIFYEKCKKSLNKQNNNFNHSLKKCFNDFQFIGYAKGINHEESNNSVAKNGIYLFTIALIFISFTPIVIIVYVEFFILDA